jgi:hypothetical protein
MAESQINEEKRLKLAKQLFSELLDKSDEYPQEVIDELNMDMRFCKGKLITTKPKLEYAKIWNNNTKPFEMIDVSDYHALVNKKETYSIFVIDQGECGRDSVGNVYFSFCDNSSNKKNQKTKIINISLKPKEYKILVFILKNQLVAGDMITIIRDCFNEHEKADRLDVNLKDNKVIGKGKNWFHEETSYYRKEISNLSKILSDYLGAELSSMRKGNYKLTRDVRYCLIEIIFN